MRGFGCFPGDLAAESTIHRCLDLFLSQRGGTDGVQRSLSELNGQSPIQMSGVSSCGRGESTCVGHRLCRLLFWKRERSIQVGKLLLCEHILNQVPKWLLSSPCFACRGMVSASRFSSESLARGSTSKKSTLTKKYACSVPQPSKAHAVGLSRGCGSRGVHDHCRLTRANPDTIGGPLGNGGDVSSDLHVGLIRLVPHCI
ncbi:hypothetical protein BU26DRAFT_346310 [Trematosphaeria pertusa]|uniref:Uncharacterized protein n=1 Tax=Trematosphaeria pertusa TaxID=390896 RepID=A0A6A6ICY9_9PLEO|nr:uncharacterized protein BU26DRAFT_346310 [Trematosphaeria pertusa]KAF2247363.1 hypothetical protein BU26DRAFT_346310 [Trematosphaeria pertusa]